MNPSRIEVDLRPEGPFDTDHLLGFLAARAVPEVEAVEGRTYRRSLALDGGAATVEVDLARRAPRVKVAAADRRDVHEAVGRVRRLLDLDADMRAVRRALGSDPALGPLVRARPGIRSPGSVDAEEIAIRAVVGQQVSVAGARTVLGRIADGFGERLPAELAVPGVSRLFPRAAALEPRGLPLPRRRGEALVALTGADPDRLEEVPGIGAWTAAYVAMRTGDPDVLLASDLVVRRALERLGPEADPARWRPFRSYATHHLWAAVTPGGSRPGCPARGRGRAG